MKKKIAFLLLGIVLLAVGVMSFVGGIVIPSSNYTSGELVFQSEEAYNDFKFELAENRERIYLWDVSALTSSPPIFVKFTMETELDYTFPFGDTKHQPYLISQSVNAGAKTVFIIVSAVFVGIGVVVAVVNGNKLLDKEEK